MWLPLLLMVMGPNCGNPSLSGPLVDHNTWAPSQSGASLFGPLPEAICEAETSYRAEDLGGEYVFAIETTQCSYLTVEQPSLLSLQPGDSITVRFYHGALTAPFDSVAHLGIAIGEKKLWSKDVPIPSGNAFIIELIEIDFALPQGTPILFHVDNHGDNEYALIKLTLNEGLKE